MTDHTDRSDRNDRTEGSEASDYDAIVVGAGFAGIQAVHALAELGLSVHLIEAGPDVGGVWNWNRYPGARTDIQSYEYCYSFSRELWEEWEWTERYPSQPEVLAYLRFAAERLDVRRFMRFDTRVETATWDDDLARWTVGTDTGELLSARFVVLATGGLSRPLPPPFEGLGSFEGEWHVTARWPHEEVDLAGKRVGIIGVGSTGVQLVPAVAEVAEHLTVFQRTPNYVIEAGNSALSQEQRDDKRARYEEIRDLLRTHPGGITLPMPTSSIKEHPKEVAWAMLEESWQRGGLYVTLTFWDVMADLEANELFCEFIRSKIRATVHDPATAELLCPKGYPFGAKRPPIGHHYYETYNRDDVELVDVRTDPIVAITPSGLRTQARTFDLDVLLFATGFDAITGSILGIDVRGREGVSLAETWADGPRTYLGACARGFPNLFFIAGPQTPFANQPVVIDLTIGWMVEAITFLRSGGFDAIEPTGAAVDEWCVELDRLRDASPLFQDIGDLHTFIVGTNVEGKPRATYFFHAPIPVFRERLGATVHNEFEEFDVV
jgi:cation diffusion facilitator CzcD-associated flavoprotein CzcO